MLNGAGVRTSSPSYCPTTLFQQEDLIPQILIHRSYYDLAPIDLPPSKCAQLGHFSGSWPSGSSSSGSL